MDVIFPFGFPLPTALYLTLYVATLAIHVFLMNYVIAGTAWLAWSGVFTGGPAVRRDRAALTELLRDWMPFALGGAITAGVAPLLFVQILYQKSFYTANLLLFHRWMMILPALIVGFYLLYLYKSRLIGDRSAVLRVVIGLVAFACFAFVGYSWTENHLLSTRGQDEWSAFYASGRMFYFDQTLPPRLAVWFLGGFPTLLMLAAWQLRYAEARGLRMSLEDAKRETLRVGRMALFAIALAAGGTAWYALSLSPESRAVVLGPLAGPYALLVAAAVAVQVVGWWRLIQLRTFQTGWLWVVTVGVSVSILAGNVVREALRLVPVDISHYYIHHERAAQVGGLWVFLFFLVLNAAVIAWCLRQLQRSDLRPE